MGNMTYNKAKQCGNCDSNSISRNTCPENWLMGVDLGDWLSFCPTYNQHIGTLTNCKYRFLYKIPVGFHMWFYKCSQVVEPSQSRMYVNS